MNINANDYAWMRYALRLATRAQGRTAENPAVGCVLVRDNYCIGQGWTADGGRPHAETQALLSARLGSGGLSHGGLARDEFVPSEFVSDECVRGATAYVTLEPCSHTGRTPPCAKALIDAGIARVVIACEDTDARVAGRGIAMLRAAGCHVEMGVCEEKARALNGGFFRRIRENLPHISVKIATSADEKIAFPADSPRTDNDIVWITGENSRQYGHMLRSQHQAIVTGIGTVLSDNPQLTCRLSGLHHTSPLRIVLDRQLQTPLDAALVTSAYDTHTTILTTITYQCSEKAQALTDAGVQLAFLPESFDFSDAMHLLAGHDIHRVLIEGGRRLTSSALQSGLANQLYWFKSPIVIGEGGMAAMQAPATLTHYIKNAPCVTSYSLGNDTLFTAEISSLHERM